jgi:hypothetical protein
MQNSKRKTKVIESYTRSIEIVKGGLVESVTPLMVEITKYKFLCWDEVVANNWLEDEKKKNYAFSLLRDPTIYAYAFFRGMDGEPVRMFPFQDLILNDDSLRIIFVAANQIGKSFALCVKAIHFALLNPGKTVVMISKTFTQSKELLLQIKNILNQSVLDYKYSVGDFETKTEIYFKHYEEEIVFDKAGNKVESLKELKQSRIICVPATEAALGYSVDLLLEDELFFYENGNDFHFRIAQPRTYATKGQIIVFSNPNGQQGIGWDLFNAPEYNKYRFNYLDRAGNTVAEYEALRRSLTREQFDSTVNAEFTNPEGGFLSLEERRSIQKNRGNYLPTIITSPLYIFFDFAKSRDRTVRSIGIPIERSPGVDTVYVYEFKEYPLETGYNIIVEDLKKLILDVGQQNIYMVGWDNTGVGRGVEDFINQIQEIGIMCTPVEFSGENKSRMYTAVKFLIEQNRLDIPFVEECDKQLSKLVFKKSARGYLMVHHMSERDRDDYPDSICGLCNLIVGADTHPVTITIV